MTTNAGIWIDHKQAILVLVTDAGQKTKKFVIKTQPSVRTAASHLKHKYTPNDFIAEDSRERRLVADRKQVHDKVLAPIRGAKAVLIFGPGEAKGELSKYIKSKKLRCTIELETTDKMTERQVAFKVQRHFATSSAKKSAAPKVTARKAAKATAGKRTKKIGK